MKYLPTFLFTLALLASCSQEPAPISLGNSETEIANSEVTDSEATEGSEEASEASDDEQVNDAGKEDDKEEEPDTEGVDQKNVKLEISNQKTAGQVTVKKVATSRDGWVSIHKSREDGSIVLPESIGEARVDSGDSENIVVDLWEAPYVGEKLWALLHIDAGERGTYEFPEKDLAVRKNGETLARSFVIQGEKEEDAEADE